MSARPKRRHVPPKRFQDEVFRDDETTDDSSTESMSEDEDGDEEMADFIAGSGSGESIGSESEEEQSFDDEFSDSSDTSEYFEQSDSESSDEIITHETGSFGSYSSDDLGDHLETLHQNFVDNKHLRKALRK